MSPPQHEIARGFLTEAGFHRIGFTRKNGEMSSDEREKWIKLLKESVSIVSFEEAAHLFEGLSLVDRLKDSLDLGSAFQNWQIISTFAFDNGYTLVGRIPPFKAGACVAECLEVVTMPNLNAASVDQLVAIEKERAQERSPKKVKFDILKKTPTEVIYSYSHPIEENQLTAVVRTFISDQGYYSVRYRHGLAKKMKKEEILQYKEQLEKIAICDRVSEK